LQSPPEKVDNKSNKAEVIKFLGYDWSNRKGDEGIKYLTSHVQETEASEDDDDKDTEIVQAINSIKYIETPLYNPSNDNDVTKFSYALRKHITDICNKFSFGEKNINCDKPFSGEAKGLLQYARLVDLIDFGKTSFNLAVSTFVGKTEKILYKKEIEIKTLGQIADVRIGGTPSRNNYAYFEGENLWVSIAEMNGTIITDTKEKLSDEGVRTSNVKLIPKGTTLLSFKLSIGKTAIAGADLYTNEAIAGLIPIDDTVSNEYLFQLFSSNIIDLENVGNKAFGKSLNSTYLKEQVRIPLPPKVLQQKIVAECQEIEAESYGAKEKITKLQDEIKEIVSNVTGKRMKLGDIYKISSGGTPSRKIAAYWTNGDVPWVTTTEVTNGLITSTKECITKSGLENSSAKIYPIDSLIIAMYGQGSTRGRTAKLGIEACTNQACAVLYEKKIEVETDFVWFYMQSQYEKLRSISHGSVRPNLNANDIINYEIQLPPLAEQKAIVSKIQAIEDEIASLKAICDEAPARKKAVLQRELIEDDEQGGPTKTIDMNVTTNEYQPIKFEPLLAAESFERYKWKRFDQSIIDYFAGNQTILIGCYKGKEYQDWILSHNMYNIRLGNTKGSMEENRELFESTSLLVLYEIGKPDKLSAYKITGYHEINKDELIELGYPNKKPRKSYMAFDIIPLEKDLTFLVEHHLIERLVELNTDNAKGTPVFIEP